MDTIKILFLIAVLIGFGFLLGFTFGINIHAEIIKETNCRHFYSNVPVKEVIAECYKYFDIKK